ncbi:MAG TPA: hypothetical protein VF137_03055 [Candidatus Dormibacteraeota bacterium]
MDLSPDRVGGPFDVVLFLGVLYHLTDPVLAIERVASCCSDLLVLETETSLNWLPYPAARIYPGDELNNDPSNWYQYNVSALRGLLARCGFSDTQVIHRSPLHRRIARAAVRRNAGSPFRQLLRSSRLVMHARRSERAASPTG